MLNLQVVSLQVQSCTHRRGFRFPRPWTARLRQVFSRLRSVVPLRLRVLVNLLPSTHVVVAFFNAVEPHSRMSPFHIANVIPFLVDVPSPVHQLLTSSIASLSASTNDISEFFASQLNRSEQPFVVYIMCLGLSLTHAYWLATCCPLSRYACS